MSSVFLQASGISAYVCVEACVPACMMCVCVCGHGGEEAAVDEDRQDKEEKKAVVDDKVVEIKPRG